MRGCACRWRGDHGTKKQAWFPANYVEEVEAEGDLAQDNPALGSLQKGTIDLAGCSLGQSA